MNCPFCTSPCGNDHCSYSNDNNMKKLKVLDLFAGIGGFSLGLEAHPNFETVAFCEIDSKCHKILEQNWPEVEIFTDVQQLTYFNGFLIQEDDGEILRSTDQTSVDIICGGFPCQDISIGGKQKGIEKGTRSGLWKEYARLINEIRPKYAIIENVGAIRKNGLGIVLNDLASIGYDAEWHTIRASSVGYPHQRDRVFIISYPRSQRSDECAREERHLQTNEERKSEEVHPNREQCQSESEQICTVLSRGTFKSIASSYPDERASVSQLRRVTDGIPEGLDEKERQTRISQLGNAIVPRIASIIGEAILRREKLK